MRIQNIDPDKDVKYSDKVRKALEHGTTQSLRSGAAGVRVQ
jgi:hypothetical protein